MRAATTMILMTVLLPGCSASGEIVRGQSEQRESVSSSSGSVLSGVPADGAVIVTYSCSSERPDLQAVWRKVPLSASWLGRTVPASRFIVDHDAFMPGDVFVVVPGGDQAIPDVVLGRDVEPTGPDGDKAFEFTDETGKKVSVTMPSTPAQKQVYRVARCW